MTNRQHRIRDLFNSVAELGSKAEKSAYLNEHCPKDERLRAEVMELVSQANKKDAFLEPAEALLEATFDSDVQIRTRRNPTRAIEKIGSSINGYKLLQQIGEGGFGTVFMAQQTEPVRRKVALKIIKPGMDSKEVIARFEAERQSLAMMDHPNVAKVHDGGTTETGLPYFVMELVHGLSVTQFCDENRLSNRERLTLFIDICRAVQHAHMKGIIHRDLKPSNVLVTMNDDKPMPKVIDFGVSKALSQHLTDKTMFTAYGQMVGTPLYMSPEQAQFSAQDIDVRSDIYSLGVLLYELLTGDTPFDLETLNRSGFDEMRRIIREVDPPRPSHRVSTCKAEQIATTADKRRTDTRKLGKSLQGELDWVVMKALDKDRNRRYMTAKDFADDVERYLNKEAVAACPPSTLYQLKKLASRHRLAFGVSIAVSLVLLLGIAGLVAANGMIVAEQSRTKDALKQAEANLDLAERRQEESDQQREKAEHAASESKAVLEFLVEDLLGSAAPEESLGRDVTVQEVLANAEKEIDFAFSGQPAIEASLRRVLSKTYSQLGDDKAAYRHAQLAHQLVQTNPDTSLAVTVEVMVRLANVLNDKGELKNARTLAENAVNKSRNGGLSSEHPVALKSLHTLALILQAQQEYRRAEELNKEVFETRKRYWGEDHLETLSSMNNLATTMALQNRRKEALELFQRAFEIGQRVLEEDHPDVLKFRNNIAYTLELDGDYVASSKQFRQILSVKRRVLGEEHPETLSAMSNLAHSLLKQGDYAAAQRLSEQTLEIANRALGEQHPRTLQFRTDLAKTLRERGKVSEAQRMYEEALQDSKSFLGEEHTRTLCLMENLAVAMQDQGKESEAKTLWEKSLKIRRQSLGKDHPVVLKLMSNLAAILSAQGLLAEAQEQNEMILESRTRALGAEHPETLTSMNNLATNLFARDKKVEAQELWEKTLALQQQVLGKEHPETITTMYNLAIVLRVQKRLEDAERYARESSETAKRVLGPEHPGTLDHESLLRLILQEQKKTVEADSASKGTVKAGSL